MSWSRAFDEPIALPNGRVLKTLSDAGHFVTSLPKAKHDRPEWRLAAAMLMQAADDGAPVMFAEIAIRRDHRSPGARPR
jgi:hypothetical protein